MLTRKLALARLRETGTLCEAPRARNLVKPTQEQLQLAHAIMIAVGGHRADAHGMRWLAPAACQAVLP